jgi:hypothetical protein
MRASPAISVSGLSRGKGRTERPRVYAGCMPCGQGRWVADLEHANIWIAIHWRRCKHPLSSRGSKASVGLSEATERGA